MTFPIIPGAQWVNASEFLELAPSKLSPELLQRCDEFKPTIENKQGNLEQFLQMAEQKIDPNSPLFEQLQKFKTLLQTTPIATPEPTPAENIEEPTPKRPRMR
jgi:hypothetical protein